MQDQDLNRQTIGQYELRDLLGEGGMGAVYRAFQINLKREVAIKVLPANLATTPGYIERFTREAETVASLEHAHIVPVYDYGTHENTTYIVMRLLTGGSLSERVHQHKMSGHNALSLGEVAVILHELASALDYAHSRGVIHRDIKPGNIMFDNQGSAYLTDFGIARLMEATTQLTSTGATVGTPLYMSPEQWRGETLTPATDQYSLAVMVYQLTTGRTPFEADTPYALMHKHINEPPTPPQTYRRDIPEALTRVLARALAKKPSERFPTVTAFAQAFASAIEGSKDESTQFLRFKLSKSRAGDALPFSTTPAVRGEGAKPFYRSPIVWGTMLAVVAVIAIGIIFASQGREDATQAEEGANTAAAQVPSDTPGAVLVATATDTPSEEASLRVSFFTVEPATLVRYVAQTITFNWNVPNATTTQLLGVEAISTTPIESSYSATGSVSVFGYLETDSVTVTLVAQDSNGQTIQEMLTLTAIDPTCTTLATSSLRTGPTAQHQVISTVPAGQSVVVDARDQSGGWLRVAVGGGNNAWGELTVFSCDSAFNVNDLRVVQDYPTPVPPTQPLVAEAATAEATAEPTAEATAESTAEATRASDECTHIVQPGDTAAAIAIAYGTTVQSFADANPGVNVNTLFVGQTLQIPNCGAAFASTLTGIANSGVNVRSGPATSFNPPIGSLAAGETVEVLARNAAGDWYKIGFRGSTGWVFSSFLTISGEVSSLSVEGETLLPTSLPTRTPRPSETPLAGFVGPTLAVFPTIASALAPPPFQPITASNASNLVLGYAVPANCGAFSPSGNLFSAGSYPNHGIYDLSTGSRWFDSGERSFSSFSPDETMFVIFEDGVYDTATTTRVHLPLAEQIRYLA